MSGTRGVAEIYWLHIALSCKAPARANLNKVEHSVSKEIDRAVLVVRIGCCYFFFFGMGWSKFVAYFVVIFNQGFGYQKRLFLGVSIFWYRRCATQATLFKMHFPFQTAIKLGCDAAKKPFCSNLLFSNNFSLCCSPSRARTGVTPISTSHQISPLCPGSNFSPGIKPISGQLWRR